MKVIIMNTYELKPSFVREVEEENMKNTGIQMTDEDWIELIDVYGLWELEQFASADYGTITILER